MAFKLIKLVTQETIIADAYYINDLIKYLKDSPEGKTLEENPITRSKKVIVLIDPVEIIISKTDTYSETSLNMYLPYSDEYFIPVEEDKIVIMTKPSAKILKAYNRYVREIKDKQEVINNLKDKDMDSDTVDDILKILLDLDPKKDTTH